MRQINNVISLTLAAIKKFELQMNLQKPKYNTSKSTSNVREFHYS